MMPWLLIRPNPDREGDVVADIFISYRRKPHQDRARLLQEQLEKRNYKVFLDTTMGAGNFNDILRNEIKECTFFLLLVSDDSFKRCWQEDDVYRQEIECAKENGKIIIPVMEPNYEFPKKLPQTIEFVRECNGIEFSSQFLNYVMDDLVHRMLKPPSTVNHNDKKAQTPPHALMPRCSYMERPLDEMVALAQQDVSDDCSLYQTIEQAQQGDVVAQKKIAQAYLSDDGMSENSLNPEKAVYWLAKAIDQGDAEAMYLLGESCMNAKDGQKNYALGAYWYEQSASQSKPYPPAIYAMADCYYWKKGVPNDLMKKAEWYRKAMAYEWIQAPEEVITYADRYYALLSRRETQKILILNGYTKLEIPENKAKLVQKKRRNENSRFAFGLGLILLLIYITLMFLFVGIDAEWTHSDDVMFILILADAFMALGIIVQLRFRRMWVRITVLIAAIVILLMATNLIMQAIVWFALSINRINAIICGVVTFATSIYLIYL